MAGVMYCAPREKKSPAAAGLSVPPERLVRLLVVRFCLGFGLALGHLLLLLLRRLGRGRGGRRLLRLDAGLALRRRGRRRLRLLRLRERGCGEGSGQQCNEQLLHVHSSSLWDPGWPCTDQRISARRR